MLWRFRIVMSRVFAVFISRAGFILELHWQYGRDPDVYIEMAFVLLCLDAEMRR